MILKKVTLKNFRSFRENTIYFHPFLTIVSGPNSVGKTNLLESIYLLATGKSFADFNQSELINFDKKNMQISAQYTQENDNIFFSVILQKKDDSINKHFSINKIKKTLAQYLKETPPTVVFTPSQIQIIDGRPERRRNFFNELLSIIDPVYRRVLIDFETGLKKRNKILELERKDIRTLKDELAFWDKYLIDKAFYISRAREEIVGSINKGKQLNKELFAISYLKNLMNNQTLEASFDRQLMLKTTPVGPQRDDFQIFKNGINIHTYGSRSEQRMALFWLILNQLEVYKNKLNKKPILLLDDIFSELDGLHKKLILSLISKYQTVLTTMESEFANIPKTSHVTIKLKGSSAN